MHTFYLIGDVHAKFDQYIELTKKYSPSVQLGDMGIGFFGTTYPNGCYDLRSFEKNSFFIRGNHDNPAVCCDVANYLGSFGNIKYSQRGILYNKASSKTSKDIFPDSMFFIGGAYSIDKQARTSEIDWWENEEINVNLYNKIMYEYKNTKPDIVISHDCPSFLYPVISSQTINPRIPKGNTANILLPKLFAAHKPKLWIFGHHHISFNYTYKNTKFICLDELEVLGIAKEIDELQPMDIAHYETFNDLVIANYK